MRYYLRLTIEILIELVIYFLITKINEEKMLKIIIIILNSYLVYITITNALKNKKQKNKINGHICDFDYHRCGRFGDNFTIYQGRVYL